MKIPNGRMTTTRQKWDFARPKSANLWRKLKQKWSTHLLLKLLIDALHLLHSDCGQNCAQIGPRIGPETGDKFEMSASDESAHASPIAFPTL